MNNSAGIRDRAFPRYIYIDAKDKSRFQEFLLTITHVAEIRAESSSNIVYYAKLKKQELLYIELAFGALIKKPKSGKKRIVTPTGTKKSI